MSAKKVVAHLNTVMIIAVMVKGSVTMADVLIIGGIGVAIILLFASLMVMASREGEQDNG